MQNKNKIKLCIWMNAPSPHQSAFFDALAGDKRIDIKVRYLMQVTDNRINIGWNSAPCLSSYEKIKNKNISSALAEMEDWKERIHIFSPFLDKQLNELLFVLISENIKWIHWSEKSGIKLQEIFGFNKVLPKIFYQLSLYHSGRKSYAKQVNKYALGAFAIGDSAKKDFINWGINKNKIEHLFYTPKELAQKELSRNPNTKIETISYGYVGELSKRKGIDLLIKAFAKLKSQMGTKLYLIGPDLSNGLYPKMISKMKLERDIILTGSVNSENLAQYYAKFDIFILPSRFDGWGVVLNEASSMGKALIATDQCGATGHLISHQKNGFQVKSHSSKALKKAMQIYLDNPLAITTHGKLSNKIIEKYTPENNVEHLISAISKWA